MTFLTASALTIALLALLPVFAHLLQRGRRDSVAFPLVRLVLPTPKLSNRTGKLQDRLLLCLRASLIVALALLGAAPLIRCNRPVLARQHGASVALAIVLDDSGSMRARLPSGIDRFELAKRGVAQILSQLHDGDLASLVLAGHPARLIAGATPQLRVIRDLCLKTPASDRSTDLLGAIQLAEGSLRNLPQDDRRIVVLSDLGQPLPKTRLPLWIPKPELMTPVSDCGIVSAIQHDGQVVAEIACTDESAKRDRKLSLGERDSARRALAGFSKSIATAGSGQRITFDGVPRHRPLEARLDGKDANPHDDSAPVFGGTAGTVVATLADYTTARAATGGPPLVEQALSALGGDITLRPWTALPDDDRNYDDVSLVILDDPPPFGPEVRAALQRWIQRGGLAIAWLGQRAADETLGASIAPFLEGHPKWEPTDVGGFDVGGLDWLGPAGASFVELAPKARLVVDEALPPASKVKIRWSDFRAALVERHVGRGIAWSMGLPVSTDNSEVGLRTGFVALMDYLVELTRTRGLSPITVVGRPWRFDRDERVRVRDPEGAAVALDTNSGRDTGEVTVTPTLAGLYTIERHERTETRLAHLEAREITERAQPTGDVAASAIAPRFSRLDLSPTLTGIVAIIVLLELMILSVPGRKAAASRPG